MHLAAQGCMRESDCECLLVRHIYRNRPGASPDQPPTSYPSEGLNYI